MRAIILIICTFLLYSSLAQGPLATYPCLKQISTHPLAPYNPDYQDGFVEDIFLNTFKWYDYTTANYLLSYPLVDMTLYGNTTAMLNVFNPNILNYPQLNSGIPINELDYYPEDGWELLSLNLGFYPDGTYLSEHHPLEESAFQDVPYVIFYNKQRGIIRIFANSTTGLTSSFNPDVVKVTLKFENPTHVSGLLRTGAKYDQALDKTTDVSELVTICKTPGQANHWFMAQFNVGYDPCTCFFQSDLRVLFQFIDESSIAMTTNGLSTEVNLVDELTGQFNIDQNFLASVNNKGNHAESGTVIYNTMQQMYQNYIDRLEYVKAQNLLIAEENERLNNILTVLKLAKNALVNPIAGFISDPSVVFVLVKLGLFTEKAGTPGAYSVKPDYAKIEKKAKEYLGQGFDWLSKETKKGLQQPLSNPPMPTGTIWQATFDGAITNESNAFGPTFFNPGSFPYADNVVTPQQDDMSTLPITAHNYPYYNEALGLFALIETPKFRAVTNTNLTEQKNVMLCKNVNHFGLVNGVYDIVYHVRHKMKKTTQLQLQIDAPLKYVFIQQQVLTWNERQLKQRLY